MKHMIDDEYYYTDNGEITYNKKTGRYTVWDESYSNIVCTTDCPFIAEKVLQTYCDYLEEQHQ